MYRQARHRLARLGIGRALAGDRQGTGKTRIGRPGRAHASSRTM